MIQFGAWPRALVVGVDVFVGAWLVAMLVLAWLTTSEIDRLAGVSDSLTQASASETALADAIGPLESLPVISGSVAGAAEQLRASALSTSTDATVASSAVHRLAAVAGAIIVLLALFPVVVVYVPLRVMRVIAVRHTRNIARGAEGGATGDGRPARRPGRPSTA